MLTKLLWLVQTSNEQVQGVIIKICYTNVRMYRWEDTAHDIFERMKDKCCTMYFSDGSSAGNSTKMAIKMILCYSSCLINADDHLLYQSCPISCMILFKDLLWITCGWKWTFSGNNLCGYVCIQFSKYGCILVNLTIFYLISAKFHPLRMLFSGLL